MERIHPLKNPIQTYAWGSRTKLAELQGRPHPTPEPEAELWIGAHPQAPSQILVNGRWCSLARWIARAPARVLGSRVAAKFGGELPFLLKVLAVERPLSLQAHPDASQAREGFGRENRAVGEAVAAVERRATRDADSEWTLRLAEVFRVRVPDEVEP